MTIHRGMFFAIGAAALGACATAGTGTGASAFAEVVCPEGVVVVPSAEAIAGQRALLLGQSASALTSAQAAVAADPTNPHHQFLAGQAAVATGDFTAANTAFTRTEEICPGYATEVSTERQRAWSTAFDQGLASLQAADTATAMARWTAANLMYQDAPNAHYNLGVVYAQRGELDQAVQAFRSALEVLDRLPADTVAQVMEDRAETRANTLAGLLSAGAQQFQEERFDRAAETFRFLTGVNPNDRDAWYNYGLALFKLERWNDLLPVAQRVVQIDPLNENARIILFNAHKGMAEAAEAARQRPQADAARNAALAALEAVEKLPVFVDQVRFAAPEAGTPVLTGTVTGNAAAAGAPVNLAFTFYGPGGQVGTETVTINAPAKGQTAQFTLPLPAGQQVTSFSYAVR